MADTITETAVGRHTPPAASPTAVPSGRYYLEIFAVSFAGLLLEVAYTRITSDKFFYYWTYLVIGLALLGIGVGGVWVAVASRLRNQATERLLVQQLVLGAALVGLGYIVVAKTSVNTYVIWMYGPGTWRNLALLFVVCLAIFASFVPIGVILSTLFGRSPQGVGRLYFFDLLGAGIACALVVSFITWLGAPATVFLAGVALAVAALRIPVLHRSPWVLAGLALAGVLGYYVAAPSHLPAIAPDQNHINTAVKKPIYSAWSPIFHIDVVQIPGSRQVYHDGVLGSVMYQWNGTYAGLEKFGFDKDPRALPFDVLGPHPGPIAIIGAAEGHEVLASLYFHASHIDAVELNPVTYQLVTKTFANYDGHIAQNPHVHYVLGDGRSFLARTSSKFNLIWYPAPDSYASTNAAIASASVLSESYLYTSNAIVSSLQHLNPDGIVVTQFGEANYATKPNRTLRYVTTVEAALKQAGITDPAAHILVSTTPPSPPFTGLSTIVVKRTPFTPAEVASFVKGVPAVPGGLVRYAPGYAVPKTFVTEVITNNAARLQQFYKVYPFQVSPVSDNQPFFWHFAGFGSVITNFFHPLGRGNGVFDQEESVGERVLLLLLVVSVVLAALFLFLPFLSIRKTWVRLPNKALSALYFSAIGFGFIFYEVTLIQKLTLFLGYPTYSLTVTLAVLLIALGVGALWSGRSQDRIRRAPWMLFAAIAALTLYYLYGLGPTTNALLDLTFAARVLITVVLLAPLGVCLGMFMPVGLGAVASMTDHPREYVAWGWAVNGFASVTGSVLGTIIAMTYGFNVVLVIAVVIYALAWASLRGLLRQASPG